MNPIILDITSLTNQLRKKRLPHGVPRVSLAYIQNYINNMRILFRIRGWSFILPQDSSRQIGLLLLEWDLNSFWKLIKLLTKSILTSSKNIVPENSFIIKLDHTGLKYDRYVNTITKNNIKMIAVIHDLIPIMNPEFCTPRSRVKFTDNITNILRNSAGIITVSDATKEVLDQYVLTTASTCSPVASARLASGLSSEIPIQDRMIAEPYFIIVSTIGPRKNHLLLLQIWKRLIERLGTKSPKLVVVGKRNTKCSYTLAMLDPRGPLRDVMIHSEATDDKLANYLYYAQALLFPSFTEGYGLPLIEALSFKVPVIASNLQVFREIAGDIPEYLDPLDGLGWMNCIEEYTKPDSPLRAAQLERMVHFQVPSWKEHFAKVDAFINSLEKNDEGRFL